MSEFDPDSPEEQENYARIRRNLLLTKMWRAGWATQSSGDIASPVGAFARISNHENELGELMAVFHDDLEYYETDPRRLLGHFILQEQDVEIVSVTQWDTESQLLAAYQYLEARYQAWLDSP